MWQNVPITGVGWGGVETEDILERAISERFIEDVYLRLERKKELPVRTL